MNSSVSIVTRTKNREIFLRRAAQSVASQTVPPFEWVIVNDGGSSILLDPYMEIVGPKIDVILLENEASLGRSQAANLGVQNTRGEYVLIHDDDDTLEPDFIEETTSFLRYSPHYVGVVTHTQRIDEKIVDSEDEIRTIAFHSENFFLKNIRISEMLQRNLFSPIAFLCQREVFLKAGGYPEDLDVLEDYYFNLMVLLKCGDIGVIEKHLANHHFRWDSHANSDYDNTVTVGLKEHFDTEARLKNRLLREDLIANKTGLGILLAQADMSRGGQDVHKTMQNIFNRIDKSLVMRGVKQVVRLFS